MPPTTTTRNVPLAQLLHHRGLTPIDLAERLQVDEKTVQRWLNGQHVPHRRHQYAVASLLRADRAELWPQADDIAARVALARAELLAVYATRRDVPVDLWAELASTASDDVAIITNTLAWLVESQPEMIDTLNLRAITGSSIRICLRDPDYQDPDAVGTDDEHAYPSGARSGASHPCSTTRTPAVKSGPTPAPPPPSTASASTYSSAPSSPASRTICCRSCTSAKAATSASSTDSSPTASSPGTPPARSRQQPHRTTPTTTGTGHR